MRYLFLVLTLCCSNVWANPPEALSKLIASYKYSSDPELRYSLEERMQYWQIPSVSVSTFKQGKPDWQYVAGERNKAGQATTADTRYQVASMSKPVTALVVLRAVEQALLDLNAEVKPMLAPEFAQLVESSVSLRQLLSHQAGFNHVGYVGVESGQPLPSLASYTKSSSQYGVLKQEFTVGEFRYSNGGYIVIQHLLEQVYNKPFAEIAEQEVFKPLGMTHSSFVQPDKADVSDVYAHAHKFGEWEQAGWHKYAARCAAGLWTTPNDFMTMLLAIHRAYIGEDETWLKQQTIAAINFPSTPFMGLGFFRSDDVRANYVFHGGVNHGFESHFVLYPKLGTGAVVMTNGQKGDQLALEILRSISVQEGWNHYALNQTEVLKVDLQEIESLVGRYQFDPNFYADVFIRDGQLYLQGYQQDAYALYKVGEKQFRPLEFQSNFRFEFTKQGKVKGLIQESNFFTGPAKKIH